MWFGTTATTVCYCSEFTEFVEVSNCQSILSCRCYLGWLLQHMKNYIFQKSMEKRKKVYYTCFIFVFYWLWMSVWISFYDRYKRKTVMWAALTCNKRRFLPLNLEYNQFVFQYFYSPCTIAVSAWGLLSPLAYSTPHLHLQPATLVLHCGTDARICIKLCDAVK